MADWTKIGTFSDYDRVQPRRVEFTEEAVREYLDGAIRHWRRRRDKDGSPKAAYYVDVFQSVRMSLFGEALEGD